MQKMLKVRHPKTDRNYWLIFKIEFLGTHPSTGFLDDLCTYPHVRLYKNVFKQIEM